MPKPTPDPARNSPALAQLDQAIAQQLSPPVPGQMRAARKHAGSTQHQAAERVRETGKYLCRTWQNYEMPMETTGHRCISLATWERFLLLTDQHPNLVLVHKHSPEAPAVRDPHGSA